MPRGLAKFVAGVACGCVLASGGALAATSRGSDASYPGLRIACAVTGGQLSCFSTTAKGAPIKNGAGIGISRKMIFVFKHGKAVYYTAR